MKLNIFVRNNCDFCAQLNIPEGVNVDLINIDEDYSGFMPASIPVLQYEGMNLEGPPVINAILNLVKTSQDGNYKK